MKRASTSYSWLRKCSNAQADMRATKSRSYRCGSDCVVSKIVGRCAPLSCVTSIRTLPSMERIACLFRAVLSGAAAYRWNKYWRRRPCWGQHCFIWRRGLRPSKGCWYRWISIIYNTICCFRDEVNRKWSWWRFVTDFMREEIWFHVHFYTSHEFLWWFHYAYSPLQLDGGNLT